MPSLTTFPCQSKCAGRVPAMTLTFWILLAVFVVQAQAGVIKKREIPFTLDLRPGMETTASTATATEATAIRPTHDPDIEESELGKPLTTITTPQPPPTLTATLAEPSTNSNSEVTRLTPTVMASSKEDMLNEIALNETRNKKETNNEQQHPGLDVNTTNADLKVKDGIALNEPSSKENALNRAAEHDGSNNEPEKRLAEDSTMNPANTLTEQMSKENVLNKPAIEEKHNVTAKGLEASEQEMKTLGNVISLNHNEPANVLESTTIKPQQTFKELGNDITSNTGNTLNEQQSSNENTLNKPGNEPGKVLQPTTTNAEQSFKELDNGMTLNAGNTLNEHSSRENILNKPGNEENHNEPGKRVDTNTNRIGLNPPNTLNKPGNEENHNEPGKVVETNTNRIGFNPSNPLNVQSSQENIVTKTENEEMENRKEEDQSKSTSVASKDNAIETLLSAEKAKPTTLPIKDNSLETNHISDVAKHNEDTTDSIFSISANSSANPANQPDMNKTLAGNHTVKIQDGLDGDSWKDVSNDLPEKTTEPNLDGRPTEVSKTEYGRSMFMAEADEGQDTTTLLANNDNDIFLAATTQNPYIENNLDLEDINKSSLKANFPNDNTTNAQQMKLPNNAEVWSLAGLKSLPTLMNATMETAPKHSADESVGGAAMEQIENPELNKTNINSRQSEKSLLDWSHIITNKELAATAAVDQETNNTEPNDLAQQQEDNYMVQTTSTPTPASGVQESVTNMPVLESSVVTSSTIATITANSGTILSVRSDNEEGDKHETTTTASASAAIANSNSGGETEIVRPTVTSSSSSSSSSDGEESVASPKSVITHEQLQQQPDLNEINLTLNKTTVDFTADSENNGEEHNSGATEAERETTTATAVVIAEATTSTAKTAGEPLSTLESGNVNATDNIEPNTTTFDNSHQNTEKSENETRLKENDDNNKQLLATATTTDIPITTYRPKFVGIASSSSSDSPITTTSDTPIITTTAAKKIPIAEVVDQNGNENEQKQSINVETTTTATAAAGSFNNFSSTIKTHLNEQVLFETTTELIATTTTTTPAAIHILTTTATATTNGTSEKTTSSSKDEIINNGKEEFQLETITTLATPKNKDYNESSASVDSNNKEEEEDAEAYNTATEEAATTTSDIVIGSSPPPPPIPSPSSLPVSEKFEKEQQEIEATTFETPVVGTTITTLNESFTTTTTTPAPFLATHKPIDAKEQEGEEEERETTTKLVDTYFKFPLKGNNKKVELETTTTITTTAATTKEDDKELETATMSFQPPSTTEKEETYISLLDDSTTTTTTSTTTTTKAPTTTASAATPSPQPPIATTADSVIPPTTASPSSDIDITSKIEEIYKVIVSTSTETTPTAHSPTIDEQDVLTTTTTTRILINAVSETPNTTIMFERPATTTAAPTVIAADIGGSLPPLNTIMGSNSGNMYPKNPDASGETDVNVIIAITVSVIGVIALLLLVAFLYLMRKRQKQTSYSQRCRPVSLDEYAIGDGSIGGSMRKGSVLRSSKRTYGNLAFDDPSIRHNAMGVHELAKFSVEKLRIFEEFRDVPQITAREDEVPQGCEDKNRYANVLPLPETRVVLQRLNDDEKTEYINANYVTGPKDAPNYYIACQAPLDTTVEDFWRMIWEQQSRVIIQATDLIENGVEKCAEYLPPSVTLDNHSTFGDFQVTLQNREVKDKYAISTVLLKHTGENNVTRELTHYWYKWPETGVPTEEAPIIAMLLEARSSLISYAIEQANEDKEKSSSATLKSAEEGTAATANGGGSSGKEGNGNGGSGEINGNISMVPLKKTARNQGPLTIHCSPGTGRTGTIIACDVALRSLETPKRTVDIPHIVYYVRRGRASAVLTKEQYEFIYKVANMYGAKISNPTTYN